MIHIPVLQKEVLQYLNPGANENFIDCTIGLGGHSLAILQKIAPRGKILGIDRDEEQIKNLKLKFKDLKKRVILVCGNFADLKRIVSEKKFGKAAGIIFDLGLSSWHLEMSGRGFSFKKKEPLDMRYNQQSGLTAEKILNYWSKAEIEKILREYGEERKSGKIAEKIVEARTNLPIKRTSQLLKITESVGVSPQRTFQALRIAVNGELNNLQKGINQALEILDSDGRLVIISFHSLEDRIVKNFLRENSQKDQLRILTKRPIKPSSEEVRINSRSRSAKLRAATKIRRGSNSSSV